MEKYLIIKVKNEVGIDNIKLQIIYTDVSVYNFFLCISKVLCFILPQGWIIYAFESSKMTLIRQSKT
jgi:hypothetical protein